MCFRWSKSSNEEGCRTLSPEGPARVSMICLQPHQTRACMGTALNVTREVSHAMRSAPLHDVSVCDALVFIVSGMETITCTYKRTTPQSSSNARVRRTKRCSCTSGRTGIELDLLEGGLEPRVEGSLRWSLRGSLKFGLVRRCGWGKVPPEVVVQRLGAS